VAKAFATHGKRDGKRLTGEDFRSWLVTSVEQWARWLAHVEQARDLSAEHYNVRRLGISPLGWVKWLDAGRPQKPEPRPTATQPRKAPTGYKVPTLLEG
jgi:hypothetical protein